MRETTWFAGDTCLWNDCQPRCVGRNEAQEERVHVHLKWRHGPHHSEVIHHEETVARQPIQTSTGEPTRSQKVSVNVKVWQAAGEGVKLMLHLESTQVSQGDLFLIDGECKCCKAECFSLSVPDLIKSNSLFQKCGRRRRNDWFGV